VSEEYREARRTQVLEAAKACFARSGFHQASMDDICRAAGLSMGAVYRYFPRKEAIIDALARIDLERDLAIIRSLSSEGSARAALERMVDAFFAPRPGGGAPPALQVELWAEAARNPELRKAANALIDGVAAALAEVIRRGQREGEIDPGIDPGVTARAMVSLHAGAVLQEAAGNAPPPSGYIATVKALLRGLARSAVVVAAVLWFAGAGSAWSAARDDAAGSGGGPAPTLPA
jgi:AcrR family transcriptional regulator